MQRCPHTALCVPCIVYALPWVCTALCVLRPVLAPPTLRPHIVHLGSLRSRDDSLSYMREQASPLPLKHKNALSAAGRLLCAPPCACRPCVYTADPSHTHCAPCSVRSPDGMRRSTLVLAALRPLNNKTLVVATKCLVCVLPLSATPCVGNALCVHRQLIPEALCTLAHFAHQRAPIAPHGSQPTKPS